MQSYLLTMAIGLFVSLLFFIVQGSMLYLKLFTELADTRQQLLSLQRLGLTQREITKLLTHQVKFLFFVPAIVGAVHASFSYMMLSSMLEFNLFNSGLLVITIYFALQLAYYLITRFFYVRAALKTP